jgi:DNA primase catalytic core
MARFSDDELDDIRRNPNIVDLIEGCGVTLKQRPDPNEYVGHCPFHDDKEASLHVNKAKGVWHCKGGCGGGDTIAWVMKFEKVSFTHAVELLKAKAVGRIAGNGTKAAFSRRLENPILSSAEDQQQLFQVASYYHDRLKENPDAIEYLKSRGLYDSEFITKFKIGFCDRTLGLRIPSNQYKAGKEQRAKLEALGVIKQTGHEALRGCVTFPVFTGEGTVGEIYGRRITRCAPNERHWYLSGPHVGVWNAEAFTATDWMILCEGLPDAGTFWIAGFRNVTTAYGKAGFTEEIYQAFIKNDIKRCYISYDNDSQKDPEDRCAMRTAEKLMSQGIECFRIEYPLNAKDTNAYAMMLKDGNGTAHGPLQMLINNAVWMGKGSNKSGLILPATGLILPASAVQENTAPKEEKPDEPQCASTGLTAPSQPEASAMESAVDLTPPASPLKPGKESVFGERTFRDLLNDKTFERAAAAAKAREAAKQQAEQQQTSAPKEESQEQAVGVRLEAVGKPETHASGLTPQASDNLLLLGAKTLAPQETASTNQATVPVKMPEQAGGVRPEAVANPKPQDSSLTAQVSENEIIIPIGNRTYRIRGLAKNTNGFDSMKVNVLARKGEAFFVDTLDIYAARGRNAFIKEASRELALEEEVVKRDLGKVLLKLEELQDSLALQNIEAKKIEISEADKARALELLKSENLLDRILNDFDACGVVGERTNKLVGYLAATSRKLERPLAIMVQSSSAAGKSSLMEAILRFMPMEEQVNYSAMTGQSLFYMGGMNLKHKILAIAEEEGIKQASYALKLLQSDGQLTIASTGKDPGTGRMETQNYHVEGPVMLFLTTTAIDVDEELLNRCLVLTVDEDPEQTRAIQTRQRERETLDGLISNKQRESVIALHQNAHRLLRPLAVVNNYAHQLQFLTDQTRRRRDHVKYLTLIQSVALLHQYQREVKTVEIEGKSIEYIEVIPRDIQIANQLSNYVLGRSIDELAPQTRRLLLAMFELIRTECQAQQMELVEYRFTRRFLRERLKWGATQLRIHLDRLIEMEYVVIHIAGRGKVTQYELLFDGRGREGELTLCGLIDPSTLVDPSSRSPEREDSKIGSSSTMPLNGQLTESNGNLAGSEGNLAGQTSNLAGAKRAQNGTVSESIGEVSPTETQGEVNDEGKPSKNAHVEDKRTE